MSFARRDDKKGLNVTSAAVFIVGEMAGSGVLALPRAIVNSGNFPCVFFIFLWDIDVKHIDPLRSRGISCDCPYHMQRTPNINKSLNFVSG